MHLSALLGHFTEQITDFPTLCILQPVQSLPLHAPDVQKMYSFQGGLASYRAL